MDKLFELLGLGTPFLYAAGTYAFFHWLDNNASNDAKAAFARLLEVKRYDGVVVSAAIVGFFDKVYTYPLSAWRAFGRSATITVIITIIYSYEASLYYYLQSQSIPSAWNLQLPDWQQTILLWLIMAASLIPLLGINIISDFISLFIIRRWLVVAGHRAVFSLVVSSCIFLIVIVIGVLFRFLYSLILSIVATYIYTYGSITLTDLWQLITIVAYNTLTVLKTPGSLIVPTFAVFCWLPIMGVSIAMVRTFNMLNPLVQKVQWVIKEGDQHPLDAVGYTAAVIVFLATLLGRHLRGGDPVVQHVLSYGAQLVSTLQ